MTMLNKKHSEATKKLMSEKAKGNKGFAGRKHSEETKAKMRKPRLKRRGIPAWNKGTGMFKTSKEKVYYYNLKKYGIKPEDYNNLLIKQNGVCAICLKSETKIHPRTKQVAQLSIDHCHTTGKVRGLLCGNCNFAIGHLQDSPYLCERAMNYLLNN